MKISNKWSQVLKTRVKSSCLKTHEEIISILQTRIKKEENGDLFYMLSQVYKHLGEKPQYIHCLRMAIKNHLTLTYEYNIVKKELEYNDNETKLEENEFEEYDSLEDNIEDDVDYDNFESDEDFADEDDEGEIYDDDFEDDEE